MQTVVDAYRGFEIVSNGQPGKGLALRRNGTTETGYIYSSVDEARGDIDATWASISRGEVSNSDGEGCQS